MGFAFADLDPIFVCMNLRIARRGLAAFLIALPVAAVAQEAVIPDIILEWEADRTQIFEAGDITLDAFKWIARPVVVFAESPFDPLFRQQMDFLVERMDELAERDVIVITDTDPAARSELRQKLRPRAFMMALIGKDGEVKLRKPSPWDVRELSRSIDKMPLRQQEIRDRRVVPD